MSNTDIFLFNNWVVIGDVLNTEKYAYRILEKFNNKGYLVVGIHPKGGNGIYKSLSEVPYKIDAIDLCINPKYGLEFVKEAKELGIKHILVQPGAESSEILDYCKNNNIDIIQGCALIQM